MCTTIRPAFIKFRGFCFKWYCFYVSCGLIHGSTTVIYSVHCIHGGTALIFRTLCPWLHEVFMFGFSLKIRDLCKSKNLLVYRSVKRVDQERRHQPVRFYPRWTVVRSGVRVSARIIELAMNRFYTKQTKIFGLKNFRTFIF